MQINANWTNDSQPLTLPISSWNIKNNKLTIGVLKKIVNNHETGSPQLVYYSSGSITATIDRSVTLNVTYNQGSGNIVAYVNGAYNAPSAPAQTMGYETDQITIGALSPTIPNYILAYNENQAPLNKSAWWIYDQNYQRQTQTLASATNTFSMQYSQDNWTYEAQMKKLCNITLQNNFIGVGHGGVITVNGNQVNSPSSNNMVVEQNAISAAATGTEINGIYYNLSNWTDANNNIISTNDSATFYPGSNMTYTANYIGSPASNTISMGYNIVVGQPITMHWTDNPNPNVTYQIWRNIKGGSGAELIATVGRGVQTYTDYDYIFTGTYTNDLLYYDVRQYYSVEGTYSNTNWQAVYGKIVPKAVVKNNLNQGENITSYFVGCYPNPFNPSTIINYQLPEAGMISLRIFDTMGREIKTLINEQKAKGSYNISFDASHLSSGVYFYQLRAGDFVSIKKMVLLK